MKIIAFLPAEFYEMDFQINLFQCNIKRKKTLILFKPLFVTSVCLDSLTTPIQFLFVLLFFVFVTLLNYLLVLTSFIFLWYYMLLYSYIIYYYSMLRALWRYTFDQAHNTVYNERKKIPTDVLFVENCTIFLGSIFIFEV